MDNNTVILIGPMCAGKSTIANELSVSTGIPRVPMDRVRWYYYLKDGYDFVKEQNIESFSEKIIYWKPFEVKAVKRIVEEFKNSIIDFGAGHSFYSDETHFQEVSEALKTFANVILLLPCEDKEESLRICCDRLKKRCKRELEASEIEANRDFIFHESNYKLAKHVVYTEGKSVEESVKEIESYMKL
ncbi:MAG: shikimate kinase [Bdellovibrionaceae bacterium]|jgi:shikimate kinase|nr:shikimate kinase [Pseudobdellovibrionaceae bacterium]